jgi:hypothetical protein
MKTCPRSFEAAANRHAAAIGIDRVLGAAELDQVAAAGGPTSGGTTSSGGGSGGSDRPPTQSN